MLARIIENIVNPLIYLLIGVAVVVFLWGLVEFIAKADDPEGRATGRQHIVWGLVGLSIIFGTYGIMNVIQRTLETVFK